MTPFCNNQCWLEKKKVTWPLRDPEISMKITWALAGTSVYNATTLVF
jgi:hypothetical protein